MGASHCTRSMHEEDSVLRLAPLPTLRGLLAGVLFALASLTPVDPAEAAVVVDCSKPSHSIGDKVGLGDKDLVIVVKGTCTENVVVTRDDVTLTTDGVTPAAIVALDPARPALVLDGARRVVVDGLAAGFSVSGGLFGVSATRGSTLDLRNCAVAGNSANGVVASYGSAVTIDGCTIGPNAGNGAVAANAASLVVTNSTVTGNSAAGITAVRSAHVRVGQDAAGTPVVKPVTVSGNGTNGVLITESSAGTVVGGTVQGSGQANVFVGRGSSGQIGVGTNGLLAGALIRNGATHGIAVEGGNATIVHSTVTGNGSTGIIVTNAGSARIGILNGNAGYGPVSITGNGETGLHVAIGGAAFVGATTVDGNGTGGGAFGRSGIGVFGGSVALAGNNVVSNNAESGIFAARGGNVLVGDAAFGLGTVNSITGNGAAGPNNGGVFAFQNATIQVGGSTTIAGNVGAAVQAFEGGVVELRNSASVTVPAAGVTPGALVTFASTLRLRDNASIVSATGDGIQASNLAAVNVRDASVVVHGNGAGGVGVRCVGLPAPASTLTGNLAGVAGTTGLQSGCNVFP